jgi:hypothetical protein
MGLRRVAFWAGGGVSSLYSKVTGGGATRRSFVQGVGQNGIPVAWWWSSTSHPSSGGGGSKSVMSAT